MNSTWSVLNMRGVDVGAPLGIVISEVLVQITVEQDGVSASDERSVKICKPKLREDGVTWYVPSIDPQDPRTVFIQYDSVTEQDVITWVKTYFGTVEVANLENMLKHRVERIIYAPVIPKPVVLTPPWA